MKDFIKSYLHTFAMGAMLIAIVCAFLDHQQMTQTFALLSIAASWLSRESP